MLYFFKVADFGLANLFSAAKQTPRFEACGMFACNLAKFEKTNMYFTLIYNASWFELQTKF